MPSYGGWRPSKPVVNPSKARQHRIRENAMAKRTRKKGTLADPTLLPPQDSDDSTIQVVIETPKGAATNTRSIPSRAFSN